MLRIRPLPPLPPRGGRGGRGQQVKPDDSTRSVDNLEAGEAECGFPNKDQFRSLANAWMADRQGGVVPA